MCYMNYELKELGVEVKKRKFREQVREVPKYWNNYYVEESLNPKVKNGWKKERIPIRCLSRGNLKELRWVGLKFWMILRPDNSVPLNSCTLYSPSRKAHAFGQHLKWINQWLKIFISSLDWMMHILTCGQQMSLVSPLCIFWGAHHADSRRMGKEGHEYL